MDGQQLRQILEGMAPEPAIRAACQQMTDTVHRIGQLFSPDRGQKDNEDAMSGLLVAYIGLVPCIIKQLEQIALNHRLENLLEPYVNVATRYLDSTCRELRQSGKITDQAGLLALLQGAYIFHRLIEELNDRVSQFIGVPVTEHDLMTANLIVHEVIGDRFANRLDQIIESMIEQSVITKSLVEAQLQQQQLSGLKKQGHALSGQPVDCLAARFGFSLL
ncbi:MAG: hypothetical protein KDI36_14085 [Pseudomonadales bacterium]|nr:hypothetical protein [Pseudomonadales bacterium]